MDVLAMLADMRLSSLDLSTARTVRASHEAHEDIVRLVDALAAQDSHDSRDFALRADLARAASALLSGSDAEKAADLADENDAVRRALLAIETSDAPSQAWHRAMSQYSKTMLEYGLGCPEVARLAAVMHDSSAELLELDAGSDEWFQVMASYMAAKSRLVDMGSVPGGGRDYRKASALYREVQDALEAVAREPERGSAWYRARARWSRAKADAFHFEQQAVLARAFIKKSATLIALSDAHFLVETSEEGTADWYLARSSLMGVLADADASARPIHFKRQRMFLAVGCAMRRRDAAVGTDSDVTEAKDALDRFQRSIADSIASDVVAATDMAARADGGWSISVAR